MDRGDELKKWFVKMGYNGKFPTNLTPIYNASTAPLWHQIMETVKPQEKVTRIRNEVILNYFNNSPSDEDNLNSKLKNVQAWAQKEKLQKQVAQASSQINLSEKKITDLEARNKMKYLSINNIQKSIEQHQHYIYLLNMKLKQLQTQLFDLEHILKITNTTEFKNENITDLFDTLKGWKDKIVANIEKIDWRTPGINVLYSKLLDTNKEYVTIIDSLSNSCEKVWNELKEINETEKIELMNLITQTDSDKVCKVDETSLAMLYAKHVDYKIETKELELKMKMIDQESISVQRDIFSNISNNYVTSSTDIIDAIEVNQREVGLVASLTCLREKTQLMQAAANVDSSSEIETELEQVEQRKILILENLSQKYNLIELLHNNMKRMCSENSHEVVKLSHFTANLDWTGPLNCNLTLNEMKTFSKYPLENKIFRNMADYMPKDRLDKNCLLILTALLENPWSPAEKLLTNLVNTKKILSTLKSLKAVDNLKRYPSQEVYCENVHVHNAIDKIKSLIVSSDNTEKKLKTVKEAIDLWINMPVKEFVSPKRLVDNRNYLFYQELYEKFYQHTL